MDYIIHKLTITHSLDKCIEKLTLLGFPVQIILFIYLHYTLTNVAACMFFTLVVLQKKNISNVICI